MKEINMIVWITHLGLSVALPLGGFAYLGYWLMNRFELGAWVLVCGFVLGLICAAEGLVNSLRLMEKQDKKADKVQKNSVSFNDHD